MRVFLSWSGPISRELATVLHDWIPLVIQCARPFISSVDIEKGRRWSDVLSEELNKSDYGIVCVTKENYKSQWLHFEAGAISKAIGKSYVSPLLFKIEPSEIVGPLAQFQLTSNSKEDIFYLMRSINSRMDAESQLTDTVLTREYEKWWDDLKQKLDTLEKKEVEVFMTHTTYSWLFTSDDIVRVHRKKAEATKECNIWWITPNPFHHVLAHFRSTVRDCMRQGVTYTFVIPFPASERIQDAVDDIKRMSSGATTHVKIVGTDTEKFNQAAVADYFIVDAGGDPEEVFVELPVDPRNYWTKVLHAESAGGFVNRFRTLISEHGQEI